MRIYVNKLKIENRIVFLFCATLNVFSQISLFFWVSHNFFVATHIFCVSHNFGA